MKGLVTGTAGFIGSHVSDRLLAEGHDVVGLDNFDPFYGPDLKRSFLEQSLSHERFRLVEGDVRHDGAWTRATEIAHDIDVIIHLAALAGVRSSIEDPERYERVNVGGTQRVLEYARRHDVQRIVFGSSSSVYGERSDVPFSESDCVDKPVSPYAATKRAGELLCYTYHHLFEIDILYFRFFYGLRTAPAPRSRHSQVHPSNLPRTGDSAVR